MTERSTFECREPALVSLSYIHEPLGEQVCRAEQYRDIVPLTARRRNFLAASCLLSFATVTYRRGVSLWSSALIVEEGARCNNGAETVVSFENLECHLVKEAAT